MINEAFKEEILHLKQVYNREFKDKLEPHLAKIKSLGATASRTTHICKDLVKQGIVNNRIKYFNKDRAGHIARNILHCVPELLSCSPKTILNVGAGFAEYSVLFRYFGHNVLNTNGGFGWYTGDYDYANDVLEFTHCRLDLPIPPNKLNDPSGVLEFKYDMVFCSEVLSLTCISNKAYQMKLLVKSVKPDGRLVIINHKGSKLENFLKHKLITVYPYFR